MQSGRLCITTSRFLRMHAEIPSLRIARSPQPAIQRLGVQNDAAIYTVRIVRSHERNLFAVDVWFPRRERIRAVVASPGSAAAALDSIQMRRDGIIMRGSMSRKKGFQARRPLVRKVALLVFLFIISRDLKRVNGIFLVSSDPTLLDLYGRIFQTSAEDLPSLCRTDGKIGIGRSPRLPPRLLPRPRLLHRPSFSALFSLLLL